MSTIKKFLLLSLLHNSYSLATETLSPDNMDILKESIKQYPSKTNSFIETSDEINIKEKKVNNKTYLIYIPEKTRKELLKNIDAQESFLKAIQDIKKLEKIEEDIIGFNFKIFKGKLYKEGFLGNNAK